MSPAYFWGIARRSETCRNARKTWQLRLMGQTTIMAYPIRNEVLNELSEITSNAAKEINLSWPIAIPMIRTRRILK